MNSNHEQDHAANHARETDDLHADTSEPLNRPDSKKEAQEQEQIDCTASPRVGKVISNDATCLTGNINRTQDNRSEETHAVSGDIHQEPRDCDKHRTSSVGA